MILSPRTIVQITLLILAQLILYPGASHACQADSRQIFGDEFPNLDSLAVGKWWEKTAKGQNPPPTMNVPRDQVIAFAVYTQDHGILKLTAQLYPLMPSESRDVRLEVHVQDQWKEIAKAKIEFPGWSAHFRVESWDSTKDVDYRVLHGEKAEFTGKVRKDPIDKDVIVIANMSCNSSRTTGLRPEIIDNLKLQDPDLLFFAGDQTYRHTEHTAGWIEFGLQFRELMRDRPTITIPDDHDVGHPNLWGENGKRSTLSGNADGGFFYPVEYVNMVQRQQTWHLPDPVDPTPVDRGIAVYFTRLRVGGIDFAILEDRKFKTGPAGKIPQMGPRPDHINDANYDPKSIDLPGLELLGDRQMKFLQSWSSDWQGAQIKAVLSQTAFCGAVHMHGGPKDRLLADLDCNGWPQAARNKSLELLRQVRAIHLCGDQHLAVVVKHGIQEFGDGPIGFTSPALVNTIYGRWWHPEDEKSGPNPVANSPLPWTGDFKDGLGNRISMIAYANPENIKDERQRADGYGVVRFKKSTKEITLECWPRFSDAKQGDKAQFPGWPITLPVSANDGRNVAGWLPEVIFPEGSRPVVQLICDSTGEAVYTYRVDSNKFQPHVYSMENHSLRVGINGPEKLVMSSMQPQSSKVGQPAVKVEMLDDK
ncbi:MAG: hypothetical protein U0930_14565 [Pirellulales bacterium]